MSMSAAADASAANENARKAKEAAESMVDSQARFIIVPVAKFENIPGEGFFSSSKDKLVGELRRIAIKNTDIASIQEVEDDFGNKYAKLILEDRGELYDENEDEYFSELSLNLSLADATAIVNGQAKLT